MITVNSRLWLTAFLAGFAQLAFCSTPTAGLLVALGLGLFSPWILAGAAVGCLIGTVVGRLGPGSTTESWVSGLSGFNPAILGILGAGLLAAGQQDALWLPVWFLLCISLSQAMARWCSRFGLYPLSAPAFLIAILASIVLAPAGGWWWPSVDAMILGTYGPWIGVFCIVAAMAYEALEAAGWAVLSSVIAYLVAVRLLGYHPADAAGLWALVVPMSAFATPRLFGQRAIPALALSAAALAALVWFLWQASPLGATVPPLVAPIVAALWALTVLCRCRKPVLVQPAFWNCLAALVRARREEQPILIATGPSLVEVEAMAAAGGDRHLDAGDHRNWQILWSTADKLRGLEASSTYDPAVAAVRWATRVGAVDLVLAGDVVGRFEGIGKTKRIDAVGRADRVSCLACGETADWPKQSLWRRMVLHCSCGGLLLPDLRVRTPTVGLDLDRRILDLCQRTPGALIVLDSPGCGSQFHRSTLDFMQNVKGDTFRVCHPASKQGSRHDGRYDIRGNIAFAIRALTLLVLLLPKRGIFSRALGSTRSEPEVTS